MSFETIEDACKYLGTHYEEILNWFPVQSIIIK